MITYDTYKEVDIAVGHILDAVAVVEPGVRVQLVAAEVVVAAAGEAVRAGAGDARPDEAELM